jgi:hypothetical protein
MNLEFSELENLLLNIAAGLDIEKLLESEKEILKNAFGDNWKNKVLVESHIQRYGTR